MAAGAAANIKLCKMRLPAIVLCNMSQHRSKQQGLSSWHTGTANKLMSEAAQAQLMLLTQSTYSKTDATNWS